MKLTNEDFMNLHQTSMQWDESWRAKDGRFEPSVKSYEWSWGYWFDSYPSIVIVKFFLEQKGWDFEIVWDSATDEWLLLTNYESFESKGDEVEED